MTATPGRARFELPVRMPWRPFLLVWGVRPGGSHVVVDDRGLRAVFGFWTVETRLDNVVSWEISGPYRWWRAIGLRSSWPFRDYTFGTSTHGGVTLTFREPVRFGKVFRARALTVTVADLDGLARALTALGVAGRDTRRRARP